MDQSEISVTCENCGQKFTGIPEKSFLGFQKLTCPGCNDRITLPLVKGYGNPPIFSGVQK